VDIVRGATAVAVVAELVAAEPAAATAAVAAVRKRHYH